MEYFQNRLALLLRIVLTGTDEERRSAEAEIEGLKRENPEDFLRKLTQIYSICNDNEKSLVCILVSQVFKIDSNLEVSEDFLQRMDQSFSAILLHLLEDEKKPHLKQLLITCIVDLFVLLATKSSYENLSTIVLQLLQSSEEFAPLGLRILSEICTFVHSAIFQMKDFFSELCLKCLEGDNFYIRSSAFKFICHYFEILNENEIHEFELIWESVISYVKTEIKNNSKETIHDASLLKNLAEANPLVFKSSLQKIVDLIVSVHISGLSDLQLLNYLYQVVDSSLSITSDELSADHSTLGILIDSIFEFMSYEKLIIDDDWLNPEAGHNEEDLNDSNEIEYSKIGANYISSLVNFIGEILTLPYIFALFEKNFSTQTNESIVSILLILKELPQYTDEKSHFNSQINRFPILLGGSNPRIISCVLACISSLSESYTEYFTENFHGLLLDDMLELMNSNIARVVNDSLKSVKSFFSYSGVLLFSLYKIKILTKVLQLLTHSNSSVQNEALGLLILLCNHYPEHLEEWQIQIFYILDQMIFSDSKTLLRVRGKALETASIICVKIESQSQKAICQQLMKIIQSTQDRMIEEDSAMRAFVLSVWQTLAPILGIDISDHIQGILSIIFQILKSHKNKKLTKESAENPLSMEVTTNSNSSQEIIHACEALMIISNNLRTLISPFLILTTKSVLELLDSGFSSGVQESAANLLPCFVGIYKESGQLDPVFVREILRKLWDQISEEYDKKLQATFISSMKSCLENFYADWMTCEEFQVTSKNLVTLLKNSFLEFKSISQLSLKIPIFPEEIDEFNLMICEFLSVLMKTHKNYCNLLINDIAHQIFSIFLNPDEPAQFHKAALFIIDDMIENLEFSVLEKFWGSFFQTLTIHSLHPDPDVRQASFFGLGLMMQKSPRNHFKSKHDEILKILQNGLFSHLNLGRKNVHVKENCVSALIKFLQFQGGSEEIFNTFPALLDNLPLIHDKEEAKLANDLFCDLCLDNFQIIFDRRNQLVENVLKVFAVVLDTQLCEVPTIRKAQVILKKFLRVFPVTIQQVFEDLSELHQRKIQVLINEEITKD